MGNKKTFKAHKDRRKYYQAKHGLASFKEAREWFGSKVDGWLNKDFEEDWRDTVAAYKKHL